MDVRQRIDEAMERAMARTKVPGAPPLLAEAMRHALFPGGGRFRPRLSLAVAAACGDDAPAASDAVAVAIEMMHCASLVHDDLPCFDDAETRRGQTSVHAKYGEPLAVLTGDGLIVLAFQTVVAGAAAVPDRMVRLLDLIGEAVGTPRGIIAGQAWESEPEVDLAAYQRAKTGALFSAATMAGAVAAGGDPEAWRRLGESIGEAYQVADDLRDVVVDPDEMGKPGGQDAALGRPSAVAELGLKGAVKRLEGLLADGVSSIPRDCKGREMLRDLILKEAQRFLPKDLAKNAA